MECYWVGHIVMMEEFRWVRKTTDLKLVDFSRTHKFEQMLIREMEYGKNESARKKEPRNNSDIMKVSWVYELSKIKRSRLATASLRNSIKVDKNMFKNVYVRRHQEILWAKLQ